MQRVVYFGMEGRTIVYYRFFRYVSQTLQFTPLTITMNQRCQCAHLLWLPHFLHKNDIILFCCPKQCCFCVGLQQDSIVDEGAH